MTNTRVAICALTFLRPHGLRQLLDALSLLRVPPEVSVQAFIVDNDPDRSAEPVVADHAVNAPFAITYHGEPARGISHARNAAVREATSWGADWICFIDDDEWPDPAWLHEFLETAATTGADIISGPVEAVFESTPPEWVVQGRFFEGRRHGHNASMHYATTSSVMIRREILDAVDGPFDPAFGMSGGEDTHLFAQLRERGHSLVWSDRALVFETVPASRTTSQWLLQREFRRGQTLGLSLRHRNPSPFLLAKRAAKGVLEIGAGLATTALGLPRGKAHWFRGVRRTGFGYGILSGLVGRQLQEYEVIHGS
jgi:GT2 family glycosyltransferase